MAHNKIENRDFDSFEVLLASLATGVSTIDRDRLMFEAGRQSVNRKDSISKKTLMVWRTASMLSTAVVVVLSVLLVNRPADELVDTNLAPEYSTTPDIVEKTKSSPELIAQNEFTEESHRFSTWVAAFFNIPSVENGLPTNRIEKLLKEETYVDYRSDYVPTAPSSPPKTHHQLMQEFRKRTDDGRFSNFNSHHPLDLFGER